MNDNMSEQVSALTDDALPEAERSLALRRLCADPALRDQWERYHFMRDAFHNELPAKMARSLPQRVMAALEDEPQPVRPSGWRRLSRTISKPLAGLAVAASVAAMAIVGLEHLMGPDQDLRSPAPPMAAVDRTLQDQVVGTRWDQPELGNRLNAYLVNHSEYTGTSLQGMLNYVRIAGYDSDQ